ncbi:hypothetical protein J4573_17425 [Actinomadura barringtoniae]|uniref:YCII-related domain-containing protein n=1 Tax=Actinomadura barringtoniae TaxID=1427535 RepID=A0A939PFQ3_9ACTN|nr:YciI family protein [Actinomadura barringtoniae]MBO2448889.1 hypothetical protein [Actinomadura barringtoniae]
MYALELTFEQTDERLAARPAHRQYLSQLHDQGRLVMAGPWSDDSGALLLFDTDERGMREIIQSDPYYSTPGVTVAALHHWQPIIS